VREAGVILSQAVLVAVAVDEDGRRQILAVELANRESRSSWRDFLSGLKARGLAGVEFVVSDNHEGLKAAIREVLPAVVSAFAPVDRRRFGYPASRSGGLQDAERYRGSAHVLSTPRCRGNTLAHGGTGSAGSFGARRGRSNTASPIQCSSIQASVDIGP
jgi:mutator family transposase